MYEVGRLNILEGMDAFYISNQTSLEVLQTSLVIFVKFGSAWEYVTENMAASVIPVKTETEPPFVMTIKLNEEMQINAGDTLSCALLNIDTEGTFPQLQYSVMSKVWNSVKVGDDLPIYKYIWILDN